jgi:hypothetical protein
MVNNAVHITYESPFVPDLFNNFPVFHHSVLWRKINIMYQNSETRAEMDHARVTGKLSFGLLQFICKKSSFGP